MPGTAPDNAPSISSSGYADGLGRRLLEIDRETGEMLEQLVLRPELAAFERTLRERADLATRFQDERFARPRAVVWDDERRLVVVSDFVPARRLSDAIDTAAAAGVVAGIDAALGLMLEVFPALGALHGVARMPHGCLGPGRVAVTRDGRIVLLDWIYAEALEQLELTRQRLWTELGIAPPPTAGRARIDLAADLTQVAMIGAALIVGRPLGDHDYPAGIPALQQEIVEVAQIRGRETFSTGIQKFFARLLPTPNRRAFASADEAVLELRQLVRRELGIDGCRTALKEFLLQVDSADADRTDEEIRAGNERIRARAATETEQAHRDHERFEAQRAEQERIAREKAEAERRDRERLEAERLERERLEKERLERERQETERLEQERIAREKAEAERREHERLEAERRERERLEAERLERERLEKERLERERQEKERAEQERIAREKAEAERREHERVEAERREKERLEKERLERERQERERLEQERIAREKAEAERRERERLEAERREKERLEKKRLERERQEKERLEQERIAREKAEAERREREWLDADRRERERLEAERREKERLEKERLERERQEKERLEHERVAREQAEAERREHDETEKAASQKSRRTRKRGRAGRDRRQDKLRSTSPEGTPSGGDSPVKPATGDKRPPRLVPPERAAAFEPPVPDLSAPPVPPQAAAPRSYPVYMPPAETQFTPPVIPQPAAGAPVIPPPVVPVQLAPPPAPIPPAPPVAPPAPAAPASTGSSQPIRLKNEPRGFQHPTVAPLEPSRMPTIALKEPAASRKSAVEPRDMFEAWHELSDQSQRRPIPWKIIAAAAALIVVASGIWFLLLPAAKHIAAPIAIIQPKPAPPPVESPKVTTGSIEVLTTPAGAKVLLDGKAVGTSPVTVPDVAVGRHGITVMAEAGAVRRTVRVDAGAKATLDIPIFSGFVAISAPIIFDVSERGRGLGTSENQIMLAPGRHELRLTNKDLFYSTTQTVDIEPGEILPLKIDPKGTANINAQPWAEVWVDGTRVGDTPLANLSLSIGVRDIVFRNPQYGERKVTATITAGTPATISVDMTKPQR